MPEDSRPAAAVLFLCTGNAARSVMAGAVLASLRDDLDIVTAGTFAVDGLPMSWRTRAALADIGLAPPRHASRQATATDLDRADVVVALAPEHVHWVRRTHSAAAQRTLSLPRLTRDLPGDDRPLRDRVVALGAEHLALEPWEEVEDPGGGEVDAFIACARQIADLVGSLAARF